MSFQSDLEYIGPHAFKNCKNIRTINCNIPKLVGDNMFEIATNIFEGVDLNNVTVNVKNISD